MQNELKLYREKRGLTQTELAEISGVSRSTIANLENQRAKGCQLRNMQKISDALGYSIRNIFLL
jgi:DNA-binding XRE family transcriptional regulator